MRRRRSDDGAAAVEFALLLPILLLLVFGIVDFSLLLNTQLNLTEAAREGARAESLGADPIGRANAIAPAAAVSVDGCESPPPPGDDAIVTATQTYDFVTPIPGLSVLFGGGLGGSVTLTGEGNMPCLA